jgi:hypothetical protein
MKVGLLIECGRDGLEHIVCGRIGALLRAESGAKLELDIVPMDNKARLIRECGNAAAGLFETGAERVVILWDERPAWPKKGERLCWHNDRQEILANLHQAQLGARPVHLVCIEREFESWLLFDHVMLSCVLSTETHPVKIPKQRNPHRMPNPKGKMTTLFRQARGWRYVDREYARRIANCLQNVARLRQCDTFQRFEQGLIG